MPANMRGMNGVHVRRSGWRPAVLAGVVLAALAAGTGSARATSECAFFANCTSVVGPWVVAPAAQPPAVAVANWQLECPTGTNALALGFDVTEGSPPLLLAGVAPYSSGLPPFGQTFLGVNVTPTATTFQPVIGCVTGVPGKPGVASGSPLPGARRVRVRQVRLAPGATASRTHGCARGEHLVSSTAAAGFFTRRRPAAREPRHIRLRKTVRRGTVVVKAITGRDVGDDERVDLQIRAVCRASG